MIYLDNAATTYPKPKQVIKRMTEALADFGANAGRGSYSLALRAAEEIFKARESVSGFFGIKEPENCIFTPSATFGLNIAIKGLLRPGDHCIISSLEHNAVLRPLEKLKKKGVSVDTFNVYLDDPQRTVSSLEGVIKPDTRCLIFTMASNVCGYILPVEEIIDAAKKRNIITVVDASQAAGLIPIDLNEMRADILVSAGHKSLYGPQGTGFMLIANKELSNMDTLIEGGTGSSSFSYDQPAELPERFEAGTQNMPGIVGLREGIEFIKARKNEIWQRESYLINKLKEGLLSIKNVKIAGLNKHHVPLISFNVADKAASEVENELSLRGFAVRSGLHCAPLAHKALGTFPGGTVRVSVGAFNKESDINKLLSAVNSIAK